MREIEVLVSEENYVVKDLLTGGDLSEQGPLDNRILSYAVVAIHKNEVSRLESEIGQIIKKYTGISEVATIEIHAQEIWNGSKRKKSVFCTVDSKEEMKHLFLELSEAVGNILSYIVVAVSHLNSSQGITFVNQLDKKDLVLEKRLLTFFAFSRLDINLEIVTGKHLGQPDFLFDREPNLPFPRVKGEPPRGMGEVAFAGVMEDGSHGFYWKTNPVYIATDSHLHRVIQVADLAAYFVGKYLVLFSELLDYFAQNDALTKRIYQKMEDCNFSLRIWESLNLEVALRVTPEQVRRQASWMRNITSPYYDWLLRIGVDCYSCSIREAMSRTSTEETRLSGIGYWAINPTTGAVVLLEKLP